MDKVTEFGIRTLCFSYATTHLEPFRFTKDRIVFFSKYCSVSLFWYLFSIKHLDLHFFHNIVIWFQVCCSCKAKNAFPFTSNQCSVIENFIAVHAIVIIMFAQRRLLILSDYLFIYLFFSFHYLLFNFCFSFFSIFISEFYRNMVQFSQK